MFSSVKNFFGMGPPGEVTKYEMAPYKVLQEFEGYDLREYPEQKWIATKNDESTKDNNMFWKLFGYIDGKNSVGDKISMTVPVMISNQKEDNQMKREMQFFIPTKFQDSPPDPNDSSVHVISRESITLYSKFLPGRPNFEEEAKKFQAELVAAGHTDVDFSMFYTAGYDNPFKIFNRRSEVMFKKILDSSTSIPPQNVQEKSVDGNEKEETTDP
eukprot:TRINITY_DN14898_c0_g1_i1.p1 TRINITY_DN14898_c0_g1~~TRINITY_DN14898_c0_g1_i1.p1  ORF type:complete len:214 (-),score=47.87 TRINITY_DN14898_c0_g1_i1:41-682(-)